jgi:hypothetical protein
VFPYIFYYDYPGYKIDQAQKNLSADICFQKYLRRLKAFSKVTQISENA